MQRRIFKRLRKKQFNSKCCRNCAAGKEILLFVKKKDGFLYIKQNVLIKDFFALMLKSQTKVLQ
jgi:hypothetical protein